MFFFPSLIMYTNADSARYMLSALVQSEAAVIAIVITLSLVAVQLTASSYSTRVIDIFKKSFSLWIFVSTYIVAIIHGLWVLNVIVAIDGTPTSNNEIFIWIAF